MDYAYDLSENFLINAISLSVILRALLGVSFF